MNIFKKAYCRTFQTVFRLAMPLLPYRQPEKLQSNEQVAEIVKEHGKSRMMLVTDEMLTKLGLFLPLVKVLESHQIEVFVFDKVQPNPTVIVVEEGVAFFKQHNCDCLLAFGGGSAMDCAKAVGARIVRPRKTIPDMKGLMKVLRKLPLFVAVPTTAGTGSETTVAAVITDSVKKHKYAVNDFNLIPHYALLDAKVTLGLPPHITSTTGLDALTHALEAFIGKSTTKQTRRCSLEAIDLIFKNLYAAYTDGSNIVARQNMLEAAYLAGVAFTKSYVGYVHGIAHSLGGQYGTPHGLANAIILPHMLREFGTSIHKKIKKIAVHCGFATQDTSPSEAFDIFMLKLDELNTLMKIPSTVTDLKEEDIPLLSEHADKESNPLYPVPKLMDREQLQKIYRLLLSDDSKGGQS